MVPSLAARNMVVKLSHSALLSLQKRTITIGITTATTFMITTAISIAETRRKTMIHRIEGGELERLKQSLSRLQTSGFSRKIGGVIARGVERSQAGPNQSTSRTIVTQSTQKACIKCPLTCFRCPAKRHISVLQVGFLQRFSHPFPCSKASFPAVLHSDSLLQRARLSSTRVITTRHSISQRAEADTA